MKCLNIDGLQKVLENLLLHSDHKGRKNSRKSEILILKSGIIKCLPTGVSYVAMQKYPPNWIF